MKRYLQTLLLLPVLAGCNSFLETVPDDRTVIDSPDKVKELLVSAYPEAQYMLFTEFMSDNAADKGTWLLSVYPRRQEEAYFWEDATEETQDTPPFYWYGSYAAISAANHALEAMEGLSHPEKYTAYKGEALVARAYAHFMLVNLWGKHYDPATAATDLGVPYVTRPEKEALVLYDRNTVQEVYDLVEKDLKEGLPLISDGAYDAPKYHFNRAAAHAFAARYYTWRGNAWDSVIYHATEVLGTGAAFASQLRDYAANYTPISSNSTQYSQRYTSSDEPAILLLINASSIWFRCAGYGRYGLDINIKKEIYNNSSVSGTWEYADYGSAPHYTRNKFAEYFKYSYPGASSGLPFVICPAFTIEDLAFNRAEAYVMKGQFDEALTDLNTFLSKRIKNYSDGTHKLTLRKVNDWYGAARNVDLYPDLEPYYKAELSGDQMNMLKCITDLRRKEFCQEGMRWWDIKRFRIEVEHNVYGSTEKHVLTKDDPRRVLQIPGGALSYGMQENPR